MPFIVIGTTICGIIFLATSLFTCIKIIRLLPKEVIRKQGNFLFSLILLFILGYIIYTIQILNTEFSYANLIVSGVLFGGSIFVLIVCLLTLTTIKDIQRNYMFEKDSINDPLMGIYNLRYLERRLEEEINRSRRYNFSLSLLMLDVDHFKQVNDTYGHQVAEIVLKKLAQVILGLARETDFVARYGGEEIVIVLPNTPISAAALMAERCRNQVQKKLIISSDESGGKTIDGITISIGVSSRLDENSDMHMLIEHAKMALNKAKERGRNQVAIYGPPSLD
ncbi:MAG: GGDEF domain-containing protein [Deltaproteobacteria bacterium]|nr:GGDEF domain-containing protein [Deltaproteobacteria bacterium]